MRTPDDEDAVLGIKDESAGGGIIIFARPGESMG
jgi:hypothetical protein